MQNDDVQVPVGDGETDPTSLATKRIGDPVTPPDTARVPLVIERDYEMDDCGVGGPMMVWWSRGHGHDRRAFIDALIAECDDDIPRISWDDPLVELWQSNVRTGTGVEYRRSRERSHPRSGQFPVTVLDLERGRRGAPKCSVRDCDGAWYSTPPVKVAIEAEGEHWSIDVPLCREHSRRMPDSHYRMAVIPIGATIMLERAAGGVS